MSRKLLAFLLRELKLIRIICNRCDGIVELPLDKVKPPFAKGQCPLCERPFCVGTNHIYNLVNAIQAIQGEADKLDIEFILDDKS